MTQTNEQDLVDAEPARPPQPGRSNLLRVLATAGVVVLLLAGAAALSWWIKISEPVARREGATRKSAALVETITVTRGAHRPVIRVLGSVEPAREIELSPRVGGAIVAVDPGFVPGGIVRKGDPLVRIDPADYEQAIAVREGELGQVEAELAIEQGQQRVAEAEFELLGESIDPANRPLVLREPQIASLRHKRKAAAAALEQARLALARTEIVAPFDAQVLERFVELGSQVAVGDPLARLVGTDEYWVVATVPLAVVRWIELAGPDRAGAGATIRHRAVWEQGSSRRGVVQRLIGEVDQTTRLARVIVAVPDPLGADGEPPLILGTVVQVEIEGRSLDDVVRLERAYLRQDDTVWVMNEGELRIRKVEVDFADGEHAYVRAGLDPGDKVVTTNLATVVDGLPIREAQSSPGGSGGGDD